MTSDEFLPNEVLVRVNAPLTTISHAYLVHSAFLGDMFGKPSQLSAPQPIMAAAIEYTLLRRAYEDNPVALAVLELHAPELGGHGWTYCNGCDAGIEEAADWPCSTIDTLWEVSGAHRPAVG